MVNISQISSSFDLRQRAGVSVSRYLAWFSTEPALKEYMDCPRLCPVIWEEVPSCLTVLATEALERRLVMRVVYRNGLYMVLDNGQIAPLAVFSLLEQLTICERVAELLLISKSSDKVNQFLVYTGQRQLVFNPSVADKHNTLLAERVVAHLRRMGFDAVYSTTQQSNTQFLNLGDLQQAINMAESDLDSIPKH